MNAQSPIVSEFETPELAAAYEQWLRDKVAASLADPRPAIPHDQVIAEIRAIVTGQADDAKTC
ncbi:MAG: stability determinant [Proteobacteria bacterium]|nr:stability determinant [Pseudomonadota bacterium]